MSYSRTVYGGVAGLLIIRIWESEFHTGNFLVGGQKDERCSNATRA